MNEERRRTPGFKYRPEPRQKSADPVPRACWVYFITTDEVAEYPIKIGISYESVERRVRDLQTACPYKLKVLATVEGTSSYEWLLHHQLRQHRLCGEWFRHHPDVLEEVKIAIKRQKKYDEKRRLDLEAWNALPQSAKDEVFPPAPDWREMADRVRG